jgi:hypothetical protein
VRDFGDGVDQIVSEGIVVVDDQRGHRNPHDSEQRKSGGPLTP